MPWITCLPAEGSCSAAGRLHGPVRTSRGAFPIKGVTRGSIMTRQFVMKQQLPRALNVSITDARHTSKAISTWLLAKHKTPWWWSQESGGRGWKGEGGRGKGGGERKRERIFANQFFLFSFWRVWYHPGKTEILPKPLPRGLWLRELYLSKAVDPTALILTRKKKKNRRQFITKIQTWKYFKPFR